MLTDNSTGLGLTTTRNVLRHFSSEHGSSRKTAIGSQELVGVRCIGGFLVHRKWIYLARKSCWNQLVLGGRQHQIINPRA